MTTKLTLTVEKSVIEKAKKYAKKNQTSVSSLVQEYFENIFNDINEEELSPIVKRIVKTSKINRI